MEIRSQIFGISTSHLEGPGFKYRPRAIVSSNTNSVCVAHTSD
jgi:hypothetical protein